jgi:hypothetical protein
MKSKQVKREEALIRRYKDRGKYEKFYGRCLERVDRKNMAYFAVRLYRAQRDIKALCRKLGRDIPTFTYVDEGSDA